ncbi:hypothetical protein MKX01_021774 [Papaver californicum]|nr:hypothetical protein MKX01_021774 [Papaver californicum]
MKQCPTLSKVLEDNNVPPDEFAEKINDSQLARYSDAIRANYKSKESSKSKPHNNHPAKMTGARTEKGKESNTSKGDQDTTWSNLPDQSQKNTTNLGFQPTPEKSAPPFYQF